jgi:opacity protein-like surface antigen
MKKFTRMNGLMVGLLLAIVSPFVHAQSFEKGKVIISAGYGIGNLNKSLFNTYSGNIGYKYSGTGPLFAKFEYGISDKVGFGVNVNHIGANITYNEEGSNGETYQSKLNWKNTSVLARLNLHFSRSEKLDAYWGAGLGYRFGGWKYSDNDPNSVDSNYEFKTVIPFGFETTIGVRYYIVEHVGIYAEAGIAKAPLQFGLSVAF